MVMCLRSCRCRTCRGKRVARQRIGQEEEGEDFMNQLPDEILVRILSLLGSSGSDVKELASTSLVSKRWRHLWKFTTHLLLFHLPPPSYHYLPVKLIDQHALTFAESVCRVLQTLQYASSSSAAATHLPLEEFRIRYDLFKANGSELFSTLSVSLNVWLYYALAVRSGVQVIELSLRRDWMYSCRSPIFPADLWIMRRKVPTAAGFKSLKDLTFKGINVSCEILHYFLYNCPLLQRLSVHRSAHLEALRVVGPSLALKYLEICDCYKINNIVIANVPTLTHLICTETEIKNWSLENVPSLIEISVSVCYYKTFKDCYDMIAGCLSQLETLAFEIRKQDKFAEFNTSFESTSLKKLVLNNIRVTDDESILRYTSLIEGSPFLKKFVLHTSFCFTIPCIDRQCKVVRKLGVKFPHQHLEEVELTGYYGRTSDIELVLYFIENTVSLKKIIIDPCDYSPPHSLSFIAFSRKIKRERAALRYAKQQLASVLPSGIQLEFRYNPQLIQV